MRRTLMDILTLNCCTKQSLMSRVSTQFYSQEETAAKADRRFPWF